MLDRYASWLSEPTSSFAIVVAAMVWAGQPLMAIMLLAALQSIPDELYEAARVDGANAWQRFWYVTLLHIMPTILFIVLLRMIWMSNHIDMTFIMTRGGPGFANYTEAVYSFMLPQRFEIGYSSAVAVVLAIILMTASAFLSATSRARCWHDGAGNLARGQAGRRSARRGRDPGLLPGAVHLDGDRLDHARGAARPCQTLAERPECGIFPGPADPGQLRRPFRLHALRDLFPQ